MHWSTLLYQAADSSDGGPRSFPLANEASVARRYGYAPPNEEYERLFLRKATIPRSQRHESAPRSSAGWLIPDPHDDDSCSLCQPVFVANSLMSAIWLLREMLPDGTLSSDGWDSLVYGAQSVADDGVVVEPPSAQKPSASPLSEHRKRPTPSAQTLSSKRARSEAPETPSASPQLSERGESSEEQQLERTTTTTNHNRRAERERDKKLEVSRTKKRFDLGLVEPGDKASLQERAAYASIARQDESTIAWIIKQPVSDDSSVDFYNAARTPYFTACTLLERARALGNHASRYHAAQFLQAWRERGSAFRSQGRPDGSQSSLDSDQSAKRKSDQLLVLLGKKHAADFAFCFAWDMCNRSEGEMAAVHIEYRWAAALLGQAYVNKIAQIKQDDMSSSNDRTRNRYGKGPVRKEALVALLELVSLNPTDKDRLVFRKRLAKAMRWYTVTQLLGWGSLTLMPHDRIPNSWIESTLRNGELDVWAHLVKKENPDVHTASRALEAWLGPEGIAGGSISKKQTLSIEAEAPATIYEVEEIQDSEGDEMEEDLEPSQSQKAPTVPLPARSLRQLTLLELFCPVD